MNTLKFKLASFIIFFLLILGSWSLYENKALVVENSTAVLVYHLYGGRFADFHLKQNSLKPFATNYSDSSLYGQNSVLKLNSSGFSELEIYKSSRNLNWDLVNSPISKNGNMEMMMKGELLKEKLTVKKTVKLDLESPVCLVQEEYINHDRVSARVNISQIVQLNEEFVDGASIYSNVDLQTKLEASNKSLNLTAKIPSTDNLTWFTISNPKKSLLIGYLIKSTEYSTISYKQSNHGYSMSFESANSTGFVDDILSGGNAYKSYTCFLFPITKDFKGVSAIEIFNNRVVLTEASNQKRKMDIGKAIHP